VPGPQVHLPAWYLEGFAARPEAGDAGPQVWAYRPWIGEWKRAPASRPAGAEHHFDDLEEGALDGLAALGDEMAALGADLAPLLREGLGARRPLAAGARGALGRFVALAAVRNARGAGALPLAEARAGVEALERLLGEMGWVFWLAPGKSYFITSSTPFHAALPARDRISAGFRLTEPEAEVTMPLTARAALHGTWRRKGELWREASEDAHLELNGRTCKGASGFLVSPEAALPG
jgi:hypothetical protein